MKKILIGLICVFAVIIGFLFQDIDNSYSSKFNLRAINEHAIIIGEDFFLSEESFKEGITDIASRLRTSAISKAFLGLDVPIHLGINSLGGLLYYYDILDSVGSELEKAHVVCTISSASSMTFTFIIKYCDERLMLPNAVVMSHQAYHSLLFSKLFTDSTLRKSLQYSDEEAFILGQDKDFWFKLTRESGDKEFSVEELKKYKIATGFIKEK